MMYIDVEEMTAKERRKHMMNKLETLGAKVCESNVVNLKHFVLMIGIEIRQCKYAIDYASRHESQGT